MSLSNETLKLIIRHLKGIISALSREVEDKGKPPPTPKPSPGARRNGGGF